MSYKILVMGLPGSGKTTTTQLIKDKIQKTNTITWFNADTIRSQYNDWDFSLNGRIRAAERFSKLSEDAETEFVICDFIAPLEISREIFDADYIVWMNTIKEGRFDDTNQMFIPPKEFNYVLEKFPSNKDIEIITNSILGLDQKFNQLENIQVTEFAYKKSDYIGIDSPKLCMNKTHFKECNDVINYSFNDRGFRDKKWKDNNLNDVVWCLGDSFTVGLGQPQEEMWSSLLDNTINVSMIGASNEWISRCAFEILEEIKPKNMIIQWSYLHRREHKDTNKSSFQRILHHDGISDSKDDFLNFFECLDKINTFDTNIIHSFIPNIVDERLYSTFLSMIKTKYKNINLVEDNRYIDRARDYHHYGFKTSQRYVNSYKKLIK